MKKFLWMLPLALAAACLSNPKPEARPANGHIEPRAESVDLPEVDEDPILAGIQQWRDCLINGDFEGFHESTSYFYRAQWLFDVLRAASLDRRAMPRVEELSSERVMEVNQWYDLSYNRTVGGEPVAELPPRIHRDPWLRNVLRDNFEATHLDQAMRVRDWGFHLKTAQAKEAWLIVDVPGTPSDPLMQMILEEDRWRVQYGIQSGTR